MFYQLVPVGVKNSVDGSTNLVDLNYFNAELWSDIVRYLGSDTFDNVSFAFVSNGDKELFSPFIDADGCKPVGRKLIIGWGRGLRNTAAYIGHASEIIAPPL